MRGTVAKLTALQMLSMFSSAGAQALMAAHLGAGAERDALFVAMTAPVFLNTLILGSFGVVMTPAILQQNSPAGRRRVAVRSALWLGGLTLLLVPTLYFARRPFLAFLAPGLDAQVQAYTAQLLSLIVAMIPIQACTVILSGYSVARGDFFLPSVGALLSNLVVLVSLIVAGNSTNARLIAVATLGGAVAALLVQLLPYLWEGKTEPEPHPERDSTARVFRQAGPLVLSGLASRSTPMVERHFASLLGTGTISYLGYSGYLLSFLVMATATPTSTAYYPEMCRLWNLGEIQHAGNLLKANVLRTFVNCLGCAGLILLVAREGLMFLLPYTKFTEEGMERLAAYISILMVAYVFQCCCLLLARFLYAAEKAQHVAILDFVGAGTYALTVYALITRLNGAGLATAISMQAVINVVICGYLAVKALPKSFDAAFARRTAGIVLGWVLALGVGYLLQHALAERLVPVAATALSALAYLLIVFPTVKYGHRLSKWEKPELVPADPTAQLSS